MLVGRRLFPGDSVPEVLAAVLRSDPDLDALPPQTPPGIRRLLQRCLRREPRSRQRDIGDARIILEESLAGHDLAAAEGTSTPDRARPGLLAGGLLLAVGVTLGAGLVSLWQMERDAAPGWTTHLAIPIGSTLRVSRQPLLAPDGRTAIFRAIDVAPRAPDHLPRLYIRRLEEGKIVELPGSKDVTAFALSPDGKWIALVAPTSDKNRRRQLLKVPLDLALPPVKIADWPVWADPWTLLWPSEAKILALRSADRAVISFSPDAGPPGTPIEIRSDPGVGAS